MKSRTVITLWIIAIVLGIIASIVQFGGNDDSITHTKLKPGEKILPDLPIRSITKVTISQGENSTHLSQLGDGVWGVSERADYPVNYEKLRNLLGALGTVEIAQGYPADSKHFARYGLKETSAEASERGLRVTMAQSDGTVVADVFLGKYSGTSRAAGRFLRLSNDGTGVYAVGETFPGITADPKDWLGKDFLKIEKIKSIAVSAPADPAFKPWKLIRHPNTDGTINENGQFKLADMSDDEVMQLTSTNPLRNLFSYASFLDVLTTEKAKESANPDKKLKRQAVVTTFDGLTYTLTFRPQKEQPKDPEADPRLPAVQPNYLLTVEVSSTSKKKSDSETLKKLLDTAHDFGGRIYQVSQSTVSPLQKKRADFVKSKNKPTATTPPVRVP